jgi:RNA polymerase sigma-70 factor (ECF subfamily)
VRRGRWIELFRAALHPYFVTHSAAGSAPTDADLLAAARGGNAGALAVLLERHRARLYATALGILGYRADAEDAVQETCLVALRRAAAVRDPSAVAAWLQTVVRRECLRIVRRRRGEILTDVLPERADTRAGAEDRLEQLELHDWIWSALDRLPEALRVTALLRYFGSYDSYDELAAILGVPVGTVRSRLSEVRSKLADALRRSAAAIDDEARIRAAGRAQFWSDAFADIFRRGDSTRFITHFDRDLVVGWSHGKLARGREHLAAEIEADLAAGVRLDIARVVSHDGLAVVEGRFVNPPDAIDHCPPGIALVLFQAGARPTRIRMHLAPRPPRAADD